MYNFYELRLMKADEVGMDKIWKAAQTSDYQAFVSMDSEEAQSVHILVAGWDLLLIAFLQEGGML